MQDIYFAASYIYRYIISIFTLMSKPNILKIILSTTKKKSVHREQIYYTKPVILDIFTN